MAGNRRLTAGKPTGNQTSFFSFIVTFRRAVFFSTGITDIMMDAGRNMLIDFSDWSDERAPNQ